MGDHYYYCGELTFKETAPQEDIDAIVQELKSIASGWLEDIDFSPEDRSILISNEFKNSYFEETLEPYLDLIEDSRYPITCEGPNMSYGMMFMRVKNGEWEYCDPVPGWELDKEKQRAADLLGANIELSAAIEDALREAEEIERFSPGLFDLNVIFRLQRCLQE